MFTNGLTLIEDDVLDEILEKAFAYEVYIEYGNELIPSESNKKIIKKKKDFLTNYVTINIDLHN